MIDDIYAGFLQWNRGGTEALGIHTHKKLLQF